MNLCLVAWLLGAAPAQATGRAGPPFKIDPCGGGSAVRGVSLSISRPDGTASKVAVPVGPADDALVAPDVFRGPGL